MTPDWPSIERFLFGLLIALSLILVGAQVLFSDAARLLQIFRARRVRWSEKNAKMNTSEILASLRAQRDRILKAIAALEGSSARRVRPGRRGTEKVKTPENTKRDRKG